MLLHPRSLGEPWNFCPFHTFIYLVKLQKLSEASRTDQKLGPVRKSWGAQLWKMSIFYTAIGLLIDSSGYFSWFGYNWSQYPSRSTCHDGDWGHCAQPPSDWEVLQFGAIVLVLWCSTRLYFVPMLFKSYIKLLGEVVQSSAINLGMAHSSLVFFIRSRCSCGQQMPGAK